MRAWLAAAAVLALTSPAAAAPKGAQAKAAFDRGVAAYQKEDFAAASDALATSFKLEADVETLFAWAQAERQLERCEKAIELFEKLLTFDLPAENKKVVRGKIDECKAIIAAKQPTPPPPDKQPVLPETQPTPPPEAQPGGSTADPPDKAGPIRVDGSVTAEGRSPWWKDPIGDALVGLGVVGVGVGTFFLVTGWQAEKNATDSNYRDEYDRAESRGKIGVISTIAGGVLIVGGIVRYATRGGGSKERAAVTGWIAPEGGGIAAIGRF